ncbi:MAG: T9SS type A sorting domain-containing protein [Saprospiraceae bacterium]|nr:T9SS type A sorting domain-containing protein [Saprospiraceae bacterium]
MKQIFVFSFILFIGLFTLHAQTASLKPSHLVSQSKRDLKAIPVNLFKLSYVRHGVTIPDKIVDYSILKLNKEELNQINGSKTPFISLAIPQQGRNDLNLELVEIFPFAPGFSVIEAPSMKIVKVNTGKHYRGIIKGQERSVAAISIYEDQIMGFVSHPSASGNMVIGKLDGSEDHIMYQDNQISTLNNFKCSAKDNSSNYTVDDLKDNHSGTRALTDCTRLYFEVNYDIYLNKGSSTANVTSYVTGIFNQVSTLYAAEQINTVISEIVIWTQVSPYTSTTSSGMLNQFTDYRQGFNGDLAQLLSYQASGGIAYVDGLCRSNPDYSMSYSGIQASYQNVPTYSWTVEVVTHEFGHLFGSQHTHACAWNGNNTAIDGCYTTEGGCPNPGLPPSGTIMSYCHLTNAGINFSNGFGTQPGNVIRSRVASASCLQACSGGGGGGGGGNPCTENVLSLEIRTDNYPSETTWDIRNSAGTILYAGGPYATPNSLNTIPVCLPSACFTFNIYDSYGDGICCSFGSGYYNIKQGGSVLITGGQFLSAQSQNFCASGSTPTCTDGIQNGTETGIDCGGTCPVCPTCTDGIQNGTETGIDCGGACPVCPTCTDGIQNGTETGIDCGGTCPVCPTCTDGIQNGTETGIDCGGSCSPCATSTCTDGIQNGTETGIDCGGSCPACPTSGVQVTNIAGHYFETGMDGWADGGNDCARVSSTHSPEGNFSIQIRDNSGVPSAMTSPVYDLSQFDSITVEYKFKAVSFETNEDFWLRYYNGSSWTTIKAFVLPTDFANNTVYTRKVKINGPLASNAQIRFQADASDDTDQIYIDAVIIKGYKTNNGPTCSDGIQNGTETGIDCGGICTTCGSCSDGIQNGTETGIDCGGTCSPCATCSDGIQNGTETGIDCGGICPACPTCSDGIQNGTETGIDCGGSCPACPSSGTVTLSGHYFETGWDGWLDGGSDVSRYLGALSPEGQYSIRIRDNSGEQSAMTSPIYDLSSFNTVNVQFMFKAEGMDTSEDFWIRYYNGSTWTTIATFTSGTNFVNNQLYTATVTITGTLSNVSRFRFQCDASENDDNVHIDAVIITASTGSGMVNNSLTITTLPEIVSFNESVYDDFLIYPNPVDDILKIKSSDEIKKVKVYDLSGQLIMSEGQGFETQIDMSNFDSGMYLLRIETEDNIYSKRIVKK